jgi:hypothetical protein
MATDRVIYQSESLYTSKLKGTGASDLIDDGDLKEINRVQDMSYNLEVSRTDVNEFGQLAALSREVTEPPTVGLDFSYYLTDGTQEADLGFNINSGSNFQLSGAIPMTKQLLDGSNDFDELNYYVVTVPEGEDVHGQNPVSAADHGVIGIGNGFITSYGITAAVGELASASVSVEASNIMFKNGLNAAFDNPAIDTDSSTGARLPNKVNFTNVTSSDGDISVGGEELFAIRPGDISIDFDAKGYFNTNEAGKLSVGGAVLPGVNETKSQSAIHVQNISLDVPVGRSPLNRLGSLYPFKRKVDFPVNMTLSVSALMTEFSDGSLDGLLCGSEQKRDIAIVLNTRCGKNNALVYLMKNAILDTQSFSASIGDNKTVDLTFSSQVGGANDSENGIFLISEAGNSVTANSGLPVQTPTVTTTTTTTTTPTLP